MRGRFPFPSLYTDLGKDKTRRFFVKEGESLNGKDQICSYFYDKVLIKKEGLS